MAGGSRRVLPTKAVVMRRSVKAAPRRRAVRDMFDRWQRCDTFQNVPLGRVDSVARQQCAAHCSNGRVCCVVLQEHVLKRCRHSSQQAFKSCPVSNPRRRLAAQQGRWPGPSALEHS